MKTFRPMRFWPSDLRRLCPATPIAVADVWHWQYNEVSFSASHFSATIQQGPFRDSQLVLLAVWLSFPIAFTVSITIWWAGDNRHMARLGLKMMGYNRQDQSEKAFNRGSMSRLPWRTEMATTGRCGH